MKSKQYVEWSKALSASIPPQGEHQGAADPFRLRPKSSRTRLPELSAPTSTSALNAAAGLNPDSGGAICTSSTWQSRRSGSLPRARAGQARVEPVAANDRAQDSALAKVHVADFGARDSAVR